MEKRCQRCRRRIDKASPEASNNYCSDACRGRAVLPSEKNQSSPVTERDNDSGDYYDNFVDGSGW